MPIRTALSLEVLLDACTAILLFRLVGSRLGRRAAWFVALVWACAPTNALLACLGMEGSLAALLLVGLVAWILDARQRDAAPATHAMLTGVLWGLAGLARTDLLPLAGGVAAVAAWRAPMRWGSRLKCFGLAVLAAAVVSSPWFAWNVQRFGTIEQTSGRAKRHAASVYGKLPSRLDDPRHVVTTAASRIFAPAVTVSGWLTLEDYPDHPDRWWPWIAGLWIAAGCWLVFEGVRALRREGAGDLAILSCTFLISHVVLYGFVLGFYAPWYASTFCAVAAIPMGCALARMHARRLVLALSMLVLVQVSLPLLHAAGANYDRRGMEIYWNGHLGKLASRYPGGVRIGMFDAGAAGYFAGWFPQITVVNLDGIVNNVALEAIESGRYPEYVAGHVDIMLQSPKRTRMFLDDAGYARLLALWEERGFNVEQYR